MHSAPIKSADMENGENSACLYCLNSHQNLQNTENCKKKIMKMHFHCLIEIRKQKHWAKEGWTHLSIFRSQDELVSAGFKVMTRQDKTTTIFSRQRTKA